MQTDTITPVRELLEEARTVLREHPGYAVDVTWAAIWQWLAKQEALLAKLDAIALAQGDE